MLTMFTMLLLSTLALALIVKDSYAQDLASTVDVEVNHLVTVHDGGFVSINDTVTLFKKQGEQPQPITEFQLGFPHEYKSYIYQIFAFDLQNPQQRLTLDLDTGLGKEGFYGVKVHFKDAVDLNSMESYSFVLVCEFSDLITANVVGSATSFNLDFPVYPSLVQEVSVCNTTVVLPSGANYTSSSHSFNQTASNIFTLEKKPLAEFTREIGFLAFTSSTTFNQLRVDEVERQIVLNEWNELFVSDSFKITNRALQDISAVWFLLPKNAFDINAKDGIGNKLKVSSGEIGNVLKTTITLAAPIKQSQDAYILVSFKLPWKTYINQNGWSDYVFNFKLFEPMNMTVNKVTVTVDLPEGSEFQSSTATAQPSLVQNGIYGKEAVFSLNNITSYQNLDFAVTYRYAIFWSSFRITLWTAALVAVVGAVVLLKQLKGAPTTVTVPTALAIHPEELRNYVKTYEDQSKLLTERESLEAQARKGKIPRRLYKVRSRTIESRLTMLSRDMATLRDKIRSAGSRYADMMRQIEIAQTELQGVEADIKRTEARYKRGEISAAAYHKLLEDNFKRRDRAQTNIEGVLLRLREEVS
jgi:hypothetical protein